MVRNAPAVSVRVVISDPGVFPTRVGTKKMSTWRIFSMSLVCSEAAISSFIVGMTVLPFQGG